jgi:hypothetical protein
VKPNSSENKKEITEDEVKTKMVNFYKSFFIKNNEEDEDDYAEEEGKTPGQTVDLKEQSFKDINSFDGTVIRVGKGPRYTTISDLLYILLLNVADEKPDKLETYLPLVIAHLLENGKPSS